jgi:hypothetical protein
MTLNILFASDQDSYKTIWINGKKVRDCSNNIYIEDILYMIQDFVNANGPITYMNVDACDLYEVSTSDIPDSINNYEELRDWYKNATGEDFF